MPNTIANRPRSVQWAVTTGDDPSFTMTVTDAAGAAVDLSSMTFVGKVLDTDLQEQDDITVDSSDEATGVIVFSLADVDLERGFYYIRETVSDTTWIDGPFSPGTPGQAGVGRSSGLSVTFGEQALNVTFEAVTIVEGEGGGGGAPTDVNYLVGTANATLSNEIVVGTTPGGELGGTWASPTVDASHSGSTHAAVQAAAEATAAAALSSHEGDSTSVHGIANTAVLLTTANISDTAYNATSWNGVTDTAPSKNAVRDQIEVLQPLDSDLTAIAALTTTSFGRGLLELANAAALLSAAGAQASDSDLTAIAALTTTSYGRAFLELANQAALMALLSAGSESAQGILELATTAEATTGTDTARAVTAAGVKAHVDSRALLLVAGGANVENVGAIESDVQTVATTGATETLDTSEYAVFDMTMDQNCAFTFSNPAPSGDNSTFMLILRGSFTPTFPASVDWPDATPPTYTTPSVYIFTTVDAGTTWLGQSVGKAFG